MANVSTIIAWRNELWNVNQLLAERRDDRGRPLSADALAELEAAKASLEKKLS